HAELEANGRAVGLPDRVMGNSEVGHLTMGAGYISYQELVRISDAIDDGTFFENAALRKACAAARERGTLHLLGLISTGGVHADMKHVAALVELAKRERVARVVVHAFLDGRDMAPRSALELLPRITAPIATVHGRDYAMDRDKRRERTELSYDAIAGVKAAFAPAEVVPMAQVLSEAGLRQFHTAETEKYAHVTYFFNGGREPPFPGEDRVLVPSPKVATYDLRPEMSAAGVADTL